MFKAKRKRNVIADYSLYLIIRILLCVIQALPDRACVNLAKGLAWFFNDGLHFREDVVDENLRHAFPVITARRRAEIRRGMWVHLMLLVCEIAKAGRKIHETNWREHVSLEGSRDFLASQLKGQGLIVVTAHFGNFEISGYIAGLLGISNFTVARPLDNPFLCEFLERFRQSTGQQLISSRGSADYVDKVVNAGSTLAVLGDHYGGPKGCWVRFFGRAASCHKSIAVLALSHKVPLLVCSAQRTGRLLKFTFRASETIVDPEDESSPDSVTEVTQAYTAKLEAAIRECPEQYWWLHRRWKDTRPARRRDRLARRAEASRRIDPGAVGQRGQTGISEQQSARR